MLKRFIMERTVPNIGHRSKEELKKLVDQSNEVLKNLGPDIQWEETFVTTDKVYCLYRAADENIIRRHASFGAFPADIVSEIKEILSPGFGEDSSQ